MEQATVESSSLTPRRLRRVTDFIESQLTHGIPLTEMARHAGISPFHFCRQFKRATGLTPHQFLLHRRVERAKLLLALEEAPPLSAIGVELGFVSQSHFTNVFRRITGLTPRAHRQRLRGSSIRQS